MQLTAGKTFLRSAARDFKRTGAVAPSTRALASAMTESLASRGERGISVLEVGAGSGSVTAEIACHLTNQDRLEIYEIDPCLSDVLKDRIRHDRKFRRVRECARVHTVSIEQIETEDGFDYIVSCLPFTNFDPAVVRKVLELYRSLLKPGGTLSFYEYVFMRRAAQFVSASVAERRRVDGVGRVVQDYVRRFCYRKELVLFNLPPAAVYHLRFERGA